MSGPRGGGRTHIVLLHREGFYQLKLPSDDFGWLFGKWSQEMDLNHRHLGYEPNILPLNYPGILFGKWWRLPDSNRRHSACKTDALPTELSPLFWKFGVPAEI